jgi:hypothetical protein
LIRTPDLIIDKNALLIRTPASFLPCLHQVADGGVMPLLRAKFAKLNPFHDDSSGSL